MKDFLPSPKIVSLYFIFVYPHLFYCNSIWAGTFSCHLNQIFILQKRAVRVINCKPFLFHTNQLFFSDKVLKFNDIYLLRLAIFMFKIRYNSDMQRSHDYDSRFRNLLYPPFGRLTSTQKSVYHAGAFHWNSIPQSIKETDSVNAFKSRFKLYLISKYNS